MTLIPEWKRTLIYAYSMWFGAYLPLLWLFVPEVLFLWGIEMSPVLVWTVAFFLASLVPVLRVIKQRER